ncbi:MAG: HAMP domain-containing histidine kinase [Clostridia bacterium]|nr:HAMP domain-containing histidine kinase [Clostridia bacterium]
MKKKKISLLIFVTVLCAYGVTFLFLYFSVSGIVQGNFQSYYNYISTDFIKNAVDTDNTEHAAFNIVCTEYQLFPHGFVITDENGNILCETSPGIYFDRCVNGRLTGCKAIYLNEYLTDEIIDTVNRFYKEGRHTYIQLSSLSVCEKNGKVIPVEMSGYDMNEKGRRFTVKFTDYEPDYTVEYDEDSFLYFCNWYYKESTSFVRKTDELLTRARQAAADFNCKHFDGGSGSIGTGSADWQTDIVNINDGKRIFFFGYMGYDEPKTVLTDGNFQVLTVYSALFFAVLLLFTQLIAAKLYKKNEKLQKARSAFICAAAHELKTPLAVISGSCECILENVKPEKNGEYISSIYKESIRTTKMVNSLVQYSRLCLPEKPQKSQEDISALAAQEIKQYTAPAAEKEIRLNDLTQPGLIISCSEALIRLAIDNFLSNAVKFTPEHGEISVTAAKRGRSVFFSVENTGSRIDKKDMPHIWDELYRADTARERTDGGAGMGLAVCRMIFELHGFRYGCENTEKGVKIWFEA